MARFRWTDGVVSGKDDHGMYLLNEKSGETSRLDEAMFFVWALCDGTRSIEEMARQLADETGDPYEEMLSLVANMLRSLVNLRLVAQVDEGPEAARG